MEARNATYNGIGGIDCEINHPAHGWIPFTACPDDVEPLGRAVFDALKHTAAPHSPRPEPTPEETAAQARAQAEAQRRAVYVREADPLFFLWQAGEGTEQDWLAKRAEIRERYPYPK